MNKNWLLFFWLMAYSTAYADTDQPQELEKMVISNPGSVSEAETILPVSILRADELRMKIAPTIGDTLDQEPGVTSQSFGPGVGQPVVRGQSGSRVQVLQNGLGSLDASSVSPDHANSLEPLWAESIEVIRGPAAALLYGSGAIGGVVNVIDNQIPDAVPDSLIQGALEQRYSSVNDGIASAFKLEGGRDIFAWHVDGFYRDSDNVRIPGLAIDETSQPASQGSEVFNSFGQVLNTNSRAKGGTVGLSLAGEPGFAGLSINYLANNYGIPPDRGATPSDWTRIDLRQTRYDFKGALNEPFTFADSLHLHVVYNDYQHVELENGEAGTAYKNKGVETRLELVQKPWAIFHHGILGMQTKNSKFTAIGEEAVVPESDINAFGFYTLQDIYSGPLTFEMGMRVEQQFIDPTGFQRSSHTPVSASASVLWNITGQESISLSFTRSQRAPNVQELFAHGPHLATNSFDMGNPRLEEETSRYLELGMHMDRSWMRMDLNIYQNWVKDYIAQFNTGMFFDQETESIAGVCTSGNCLPVFRTLQRGAVFTGYEVQVAIPLMDTAYCALRTQLFSDYVRGRFIDGGDIPRMPPLRYGLQLTWEDEFWGVDMRLTRAADQNHPGANETPTDGYWLLTASADYRYQVNERSSLLLFVKGSNLLNQEIRNSTSYLRNLSPEAGRGVEIGLRTVF